MDGPTAPKTPAWRLERPRSDDPLVGRLQDLCEGCDDPSADDLDLFAVNLRPSGWRLVVYCSACAELAHSDFNGETDEIRRVLAYDLFAPPGWDDPPPPDTNPPPQRRDEGLNADPESSSLTHPALGEIIPERAEALHRAAGDLLDRLTRYLTPERHAAETAALSDAMTHLRVPVRPALTDPELVDAIGRCACVHYLHSANFDRALGRIQRLIGTDDGTYASMFFDGRTNEWAKATLEHRVALLRAYVAGELAS